MFSTPENKKKLWIGAGIFATVTLGWMYVRRKKAAAARAKANNGPDGNPIIKGLVFYPTELFFGARPITQYLSDRSVRIVVPINHRKTDALVAVAVVEENVLPSSTEKMTQKNAILEILRQRGGSDAGFDLNSLTEISLPSATKKNSAVAVGRQPCQFTYTVKSYGSLVPSAGSSSIFTYLQFNEETNSLVELSIDHSIVADEKEVKQLVNGVYVTPVIESETSSLVSTIPNAALRLTVPATKWNYIDAKNTLVLRSDSSVKIPMDESNLQENVISKFSSLPNSKDIVITSQTKMTDEELLASPKLVASIVHKRLGVEFPAVQNSIVLEPRYAATDSLAVLKDNRILSFEVWSDAPEQWWFVPSNNNNNTNNASLTKEEVESHFLREVRMMFLPLHVSSTPAQGPHFVSACGHENNVALLEATMDGRRVRLYIFRRQNAKEILVLRQEADEESWESEAAPFFRNLMDSCLVTK